MACIGYNVTVIEVFNSEDDLGKKRKKILGWFLEELVRSEFSFSLDRTPVCDQELLTTLSLEFNIKNPILSPGQAA